MAPYYSKLYPVTKGLSHYTLKSSKNRPLPLDESPSLAVYQKQPVDHYLKNVVRSLKEPLELFPKIILHFQLSVTIQSDRGIEQLHWELTIKEARKSLHCVLDALGVLHQGLFHSKCLLRHVEQFLDEDQKSDADCNSKKFSEEEVQKLTKLKENLLKLNKFLDCVLLHYSSFSCGLPHIEEIKRAAKKIFKTINNLKPDRLTNLVPKGIVTEEDVLCSVLGLQDDFAYRLRELNVEMRRHQTDMYFLLCFIEERDESLNVENLRDIEAVECSLQKMGFTENRSNVIAKWIAEQPFPEHKSLLAWAQIYIENLFKYDIFLNDEVPKFPYRETDLNKWFDVPVECAKDENGCAPRVPVINTTTEKEAITHVEKKICKFKENNPEGRVYFHGTDHKGAKDILEDGIKLGRGKLGCDFSGGGGFYVADDFVYSLEWAQKTKAIAVILFNISNDSLKKGLDLSHPDRSKDLKSVLTYFQDGMKRKDQPDNKLLKEVRKCDCIIGPISRDGTESNKFQHVKQICIRKEEMADEIGKPSHIVGIVFLNMGDTQLARRT